MIYSISLNYNIEKMDLRHQDIVCSPLRKFKSLQECVSTFVKLFTLLLYFFYNILKTHFIGC